MIEHQNINAVLRIRIRWILNILASWIRIQGENINQKLKQKYFALKAQIRPVKKRVLSKIF